MFAAAVRMFASRVMDKELTWILRYRLAEVQWLRLPETLDFSNFLEAFNAATTAKSAAKPASADKPAPVAASK